MGNHEHRIRIGFTYDEPVQDKESVSPDSIANEYEDRATLDWIRGVLGSMGEVLDLPWGPRFVHELARHSLDVLFNITEASGSRNRESLVPAAAESLGVPFAGSDAVCLGVALDKHATKIMARHAGIATPDFFRLDRLSDWEDLVQWQAGVDFPLIAKPNTGGSSLGIRESCRAETLPELREAAEWIVRSCADSVLIEAFISGREIDCGLMEGERLEILPLAELRLDGGDPEAFNSVELKSRHQREIICPADVPESLARLIGRQTVRLFRLLGCRDLARADFRLSADGIPYFLEINPLPGLSPFRSVYPVLLEATGRKPEAVIRQMIRNALDRRRNEEQN